MRNLLLSLSLSCSLSAALWACDGNVEAPTTNDSEDTVIVASDDAVVATVNGVPITASRVTQLVKATGRSPREIVDGLVDFELLAAEARRRGHSSAHDVRGVERQALVQRYLETEFEATHRPEDLDDSHLRASYEENIGVFVRPKLHKVCHLLVKLDPKNATKSDRENARKLAESIHREATKAEDHESFLSIGKRYEGRGFPILAEKLSTPVFDGARLVRNFVDATLTLEEVGSISEPVETMFGWHVIYLMETRDALDRPFEEAREEVRAKSHPFWIKREFYDLTERLRRATTVVGYAGPKRRVPQQ